MELKSLILVSALLFLGSCRLIVGISNPKIESKSKLDKYLIKIGVDTNDNYVFYKPAYDSIKQLPYKPNWPVGFRPFLHFKAFDSSGTLISQYASCEGSYKKLKIFESYPPRNNWPFDSTQTFVTDIKMYRNYAGSEISLNAENGDLNFIVYWGKWMGRYEKKFLHVLTNYKNEHPEHNINIYKVNVGEYYVYE